MSSIEEIRQISKETQKRQNAVKQAEQKAKYEAKQKAKLELVERQPFLNKLASKHLISLRNTIVKKAQTGRTRTEWTCPRYYYVFCRLNDYEYVYIVRLITATLISEGYNVAKYARFENIYYYESSKHKKISRRVALYDAPFNISW